LVRPYQVSRWLKRAPRRLTVLVFVAPLPVLAQNCPPGDLRVAVKDSQEAAVFNAEVQIGPADRPLAARSTETRGIADFTGVPCGPLPVRVAKQGFEPASATAQIAGAQVTQIAIVLNPQVARTTVEVTDTSGPVTAQTASAANKLEPADVRVLPSNPATVADTLPLVPGVVRTPQGELKIDGTGEERSSLVINQSDETDPATGHFGQTVPIDSIESVNVLNSPFLAQYGRFTQSVVAVETRRGGDTWHAGLNDPFPDFRIRSYHMVGIRNETPHAVVGGPILRNRLFLITALQYYLDKVPSRTLGFPRNESRQERINSFTQMDFVASTRQLISFQYHFAPEHTNFVNPDYFNPQPVDPSYAQRSYVATLADHLGLLGGTLDSTLSMQRFHTFVGSQGPEGEVLTPGGNQGNYFGVQTRDAWRREWLEVWSPAPLSAGGTHLPKLGSSVTVANDRGHFAFRPVTINSLNGQLLETVGFTNPGPYVRTDLEVTAYVQDHWSLGPRFSIDYGIRAEHQRLAQNLRFAPRSGFAWAPFASGRTVIRGGFGQFYDHIPLDVYAFSRYPLRTITMYGPGGLPAGDPVTYANVIGSATGPRSFLIHGQRVAGAFSPRGYNGNAQVEHRFSRLLRLRAAFTENRSVGLIRLEPQVLDSASEIVLNGDGSSRYRQLEFTGRVATESGDQLNLSYVRSRAEGTLNQFDTFLGNFAIPLVRPDVYANLPGDLPNRFLLWGNVKLRVWKLRLLPTVEYRNGFPYSVFDSFQNYVGVPNSDQTRFPDFFSADARLMRDFLFRKKYTLRLSLTAFNLTDHFNPLAVHNNVADPEYGQFFGWYHRRYRFDFEIVY